MLYVLIEQDYDSIETVKVFEGPDIAGDPLNIWQLKQDFKAKLDGDLDSPKYPTYGGPFTYPQPPKQGCLSSGSVIVSHWDQYGTPVNPLYESEQYKKHALECDRIRKEYLDKREARIQEFRDKYLGEGIQNIFISYLRVEFGLKEVPSAYFTV